MTDITPMTLRSPPPDNAALLQARLQQLMNYEAEQALLGGLLANNRAVQAVAQIVEPEHFADPVHGRIFEAIRDKVRAGSMASFLTLRVQFEQDPGLAQAGGAKYLARLENAVISVYALPDYADQIADLWRRRQLLEAAETVSLHAGDVNVPFEALCDTLRDPMYVGGAIGAFADKSMAEIMAKPKPALRHLVPGMIPIGEVTLFSGDGGLGKSILGMQLLTAVAAGIPWLGHGVPQGVAYGLFCEDTEDILQLRQIAISEHYNVRDEDLRHLYINDRAIDETKLFGRRSDLHPLDAGWTPLWQRYCATLRRLRPVVNVIDTAAAVFGGNENDRDQVGEFIRGLKKLSIELAMATVIFAHPSVEGMKSGRGASGSTGWANTARAHIYFTRPDDPEANDPDDEIREVITRKHNYGKKALPFRVKWHEGCYVPMEGEDRPVGAVARIEKGLLEQILIDLVADGEARDSLYSASARSPERYVVTMAARLHPQHASKFFENALKDLLARGRLLIAQRTNRRGAGLIVNPKRKD